MTLNEFKLRANLLGKQRIPFLFLLDFELKKPVIIPLSECEKESIYFDIHGVGEYPRRQTGNKSANLITYPMDTKKYAKAFNYIQRNLSAGNTYLINLTFPTPLDIDLDLRELFLHSDAPYKLLFKDQFTLFLPSALSGPKTGTFTLIP